MDIGVMTGYIHTVGVESDLCRMNTYNIDYRYKQNMHSFFAPDK